MNKPYHIVIVTDEGYVQHAAVMLTSLFETNRRKIFHVYVLTNGLSQNRNHAYLHFVGGMILISPNISVLTQRSKTYPWDNGAP